MLHIKSVYAYYTDINVLQCTHIHCYICTYVFQSIKNTSATCTYSSYMHCTWRYNHYTHCWFLLSLLSVKKLGWSTHIYKKLNFVHTKYVCMYELSTLILNSNSKDWHEKNRYQIFRILMCYHRSFVLIKIYLLHHSESFPSPLLLFLFDWLTKR